MFFYFGKIIKWFFLIGMNELIIIVFVLKISTNQREEIKMYHEIDDER